MQSFLQGLLPFLGVAIPFKKGLFKGKEGRKEGRKTAVGGLPRQRTTSTQRPVGRVEARDSAQGQGRPILAKPRRGGGAVFRRVLEDSEAHRLIELHGLESRIENGLRPSENIGTDPEPMFLLRPRADANGKLPIFPLDTAAEKERVAQVNVRTLIERTQESNSRLD